MEESNQFSTGDDHSHVFITNWYLILLPYAATYRLLRTLKIDETKKIDLEPELGGAVPSNTGSNPIKREKTACIIVVMALSIRSSLSTNEAVLYPN